MQPVLTKSMGFIAHAGTDSQEINARLTLTNALPILARTRLGLYVFTLKLNFVIEIASNELSQDILHYSKVSFSVNLPYVSF